MRTYSLLSMNFQAAAVAINSEGSNQMVLNTTEGSYGTVTLMPQDTSTGELSYVLIVQPSAGNEKTETTEKQTRPFVVGSGENEQDQDLTVYDFDDGEENNEVDPLVNFILYFSCQFLNRNSTTITFNKKILFVRNRKMKMINPK